MTLVVERQNISLVRFDVQIRRERLKVLVEVEQPEGKAGGLQVHRLPK